MSTDADARVEEAITTYHATDKAGARALLKKAVELDPENERAWLWLSALSDTVKEQRTYLENVLRINPDNPIAQKGMKLLESKPDGLPSVMFVESLDAAESISLYAEDQKEKRPEIQHVVVRLLFGFVPFAVWMIAIMLSGSILIGILNVTVFRVFSTVLGGEPVPASVSFPKAGMAVVIGWLVALPIKTVVKRTLSQELGRIFTVLTMTAIVGCGGLTLLVLLLGGEFEPEILDQTKLDSHEYYLLKFNTDGQIYDGTGSIQAVVALYKCSFWGTLCDIVTSFHACSNWGVGSYCPSSSLHISSDLQLIKESDNVGIQLDGQVIYMQLP